MTFLALCGVKAPLRIGVSINLCKWDVIRDEVYPLCEFISVNVHASSNLTVEYRVLKTPCVLSSVTYLLSVFWGKTAKCKRFKQSGGSYCVALKVPNREWHAQWDMRRHILLCTTLQYCESRQLWFRVLNKNRVQHSYQMEYNCVCMSVCVCLSMYVCVCACMYSFVVVCMLR